MTNVPPHTQKKLEKNNKEVSRLVFDISFVFLHLNISRIHQ